MSVYRKGLAIEGLRAQWEKDIDELDIDDIIVRYGRDQKPRFTGDDAKARMRPTSFHLRSALWVDEKGREYTPDTEPTTEALWVRIPRTYARARHADILGTAAAQVPSSYPSSSSSSSSTAAVVQSTRSAARSAAERVETPFPEPGEKLVLHYKHYGHKSAGAESGVAAVVEVEALEETARSSAKILLTARVDSRRPQEYVTALDERSRRDALRRISRMDRIY